MSGGGRENKKVHHRVIRKAPNARWSSVCLAEYRAPGEGG